MRKYLYAIVLALVTMEVKAQTLHPYFDAVKLEELATAQNYTDSSKGKIETIAAIASHYLPDSEVVATDAVETIDVLVKGNPFLTGYFIHQKKVGEGSWPLKPLLSGAAGMVGGIDVTKYANALADIMIERAKQELTVAFFERFKKFALHNPEFQLLFPETSGDLGKLLSYAYPQALPALRKSFFEDIKKIPYHIDDVLELPRYQHLLKNFPEVKITIRSIRLLSEIETGASNAADIILEFSSLKEWDDPALKRELKNAGSCLKVAALFSESVRNDTSQSHTADIWIPAEQIKNLFQDPVLFRIYLGLIYQQTLTKKIEFTVSGQTVKFADLLAAQADDLFLLQNKLNEFFDLGSNVNAAFKNIHNKATAGESLSDDEIYHYVNTSLDVVEYGFSVSHIFLDTHQADSYLSLLRKSNALYRDISIANYSGSVLDALDIFSGLDSMINQQTDFQSLQKDSSFLKNHPADIQRLASRDRRLNKSARRSVNKLLATDSPDSATMHLTTHYTIKEMFDFIEKLRPYALFMANMAEAKDDQGVKAALENVILPVGSSSIKKTSNFNITVQTYLGAYFTMAGHSSPIPSTWTDKLGVTAPVGIALTPGLTSWDKYGSLSLFISLFDLGAIVDYKLKADSTVDEAGKPTVAVSKDYSVKLGQLFSPGISLVYGFPWYLPLSFGIGGQYGPGLSKINTDNSTLVSNPSWRWNLSLAVDIPLFTLKNKVKSQ